jgi:hypothetical protein
MAIIGNADLWSNFFPDDLIPDILNMVLDVWNVFKDNCDETLEGEHLSLALSNYTHKNQAYH